MKKFFAALIKTFLVLVIVGAVGWYAFGADGPFAEKGQEVYASIQEKAGIKQADVAQIEQTEEENLTEDVEIAA